MEFIFPLIIIAIVIGYYWGKYSKRKIPSTPKPYFDSGNQQLLADIVESLLAGNHLFLTGSAGTGKTYMIKNIAREISKRYKEVVLAATTGIGACQIREVTGLRLSSYIKGLGTLHSAAILPISDMPDTPDRIEAGKERLINTSVVIIDEISMLDSLTFDRFMERLQPNTGILAVGDFFQLPPVRSTPEGHPDFIFRSENFADFKLIELQTIYRQGDEDFIKFLQDTRFGTPDWNFLDNVNKNFDSAFPVLCGTNIEVDTYNSNEIGAINHPVIESIAYPEIPNPRYTTGQALAWLTTNTRAKTHLILKNTMRVLCIQNHGQLVNGDLGTIEDISLEKFNGTGLPQWVDVKFDRLEIGLRKMAPFGFEKIYFNPHTNREKIDFTVKQYPLIPAYGITVHKSQGMTLDQANIDGNKINFAPGQAYTALSRVRTPSGIMLQNGNNLAAFSAPSVIEYYRNAPRFEKPTEDLSNCICGII
ncbi:MAG: AAA family ATPase [Planctomycetes bacterium]|nr:AAA family ATPase [Planctomycetota bacterium]